MIEDLDFRDEHLDKTKYFRCSIMHQLHLCWNAFPLQVGVWHRHFIYIKLIINLVHLTI